MLNTQIGVLVEPESVDDVVLLAEKEFLYWYRNLRIRSRKFLVQLYKWTESDGHSTRVPASTGISKGHLHYRVGLQGRLVSSARKVVGKVS